MQIEYDIIKSLFKNSSFVQFNYIEKSISKKLKKTKN